MVNYYSIFSEASFVGKGLLVTSLSNIVINTDALPPSIPQSQIAPGATPNITFMAFTRNAQNQVVVGLIIGFSIQMQSGYNFSKREGSKKAYFVSRFVLF